MLSRVRIEISYVEVSNSGSASGIIGVLLTQADAATSIFQGFRSAAVAAADSAGGREPADVAAIAEAYASWLAESDVPKLFINAKPGAILIGAQREFCRSSGK